MKKTVSIFAIAIISALFMVSCSKPTPSSIAADCIKYFNEKNYEAYAATYNLSDEEKAELQELLEKKGQEMFDDLSITSYEIVSEEISEDGLKATVTTSLTYSNGKTDPNNKFHFVKVGDEWKQELSK